MTEPSGDGSAGAAGTGLRIHKVLSRGAGSDAQVLLVLGSAPLRTTEGSEPDIWVAIGRTEPEVLFARSGGDSIESARWLDAGELQVLDLERLPDQRAFGLDPLPGRGFWLARFDFSDHAYARDCWRWVVQAQGREPAPALEVVCWQARPAAKEDDKERLHDAFEPIAGAAATVAVAAAEVASQPSFELGVLFVHGIGSHGARETLVRWSEPIVRFWRARALSVSLAAAAAGSPAERSRIRRWVETHALRSRAPISGITETVCNFAPLPERDANDRELPQPMLRPPATDRTVCCMTAKPEQTLFPDRNPGAPSATLLRLSAVDASATLRESHVLFAESAWAREAFPPTPGELYDWITDSIPIAVWARLQRLASIRPSEIAEFAARADSPFETFRVLVSRALLLLQQLVLPTAYVFVALASQLAIALVGAIGLLPIPWLGRGIRWVVSALMGTLGQSYALQTSPIRRSAIVSSVALDIDWLSERCQRIVVVSHSQGAEISRLAFLEARSSKMERWYTAGAGIAPLAMLSPKSLDTPGSKAVVRASKLLLAAALLGVVATAVDAIPGVAWGVRDALAGATRDIGLVQVAIGWAVLSLALIVACAGGPTVAPNLRRSLLEKWTDFYASEDPVSGGSLLGRWDSDLKRQRIEGFRESRIFNTRFAVFDHTTYFQNIEQFVAPIALDLLRYAGLGGDPAAEQPALDAAARRRDRRTWWNLAASTLASSAAAAAFAWIAFGPPGRASAWWAEGRAVSARGADAWERLSLAWSNGLLGMLIHDLRLPILLIVLMFVGWGVSRQRGARSAKALVDDLAAAMRPESARPAASPPRETP